MFYYNFSLSLKLFKNKNKYNISPLGLSSSDSFFQELIKCYFVPTKCELQLHPRGYSIHFPSLLAAGCLLCWVCPRLWTLWEAFHVYVDRCGLHGWELLQSWLRKPGCLLTFFRARVTRGCLGLLARRAICSLPEGPEYNTEGRRWDGSEGDILAFCQPSETGLKVLSDMFSGFPSMLKELSLLS